MIWLLYIYKFNIIHRDHWINLWNIFRSFCLLNGGLFLRVTNMRPFLCRVNDACLSGPILCGENIWGRCFRQFLTECIDFFLVQNCKCVPVETVLLFCFQVLQLQHHLSGVTLVPPKVDPAGKACSYFLYVEEEWQWGKDSQNSEFTSKCPPVTLWMSALDEWETF